MTPSVREAAGELRLFPKDAGLDLCAVDVIIEAVELTGSPYRFFPSRRVLR